MSQSLTAERTGWPAELLALPAAQRARAAVIAAQDAWVRSRYEALRAELLATGTPPARAAEVAAAIVAHWARETGWGLSEWRYNIGNITWYAGHAGDHQQLPDGLAYRAFATLPEGVAATVALLRAPRYAPALDGLTRGALDPVGWYAALMRAGWHPFSDAAVADFRGVLSRVRRVVGAPAPPPPPVPVTGLLVAAGVVALGVAAFGFAMSSAFRPTYRL